MKSIAIYTLISPLHDEAAVNTEIRAFIGSLGLKCELKGDDYADYGTHSLDLIYVCTGGTENLFLELFQGLQAKSKQPFYFLTSGKSNSLAASMEILSYLRKRDIKGEIIHGDAAYISCKLEQLSQIGEAREQLKGCKLGIIGKPSDWLISSDFDKELVLSRLGIELIDIPMANLMDALNLVQECTDDEFLRKAPTADIRGAIPNAVRIYMALKSIISQYRLQGLTIRCFDLLTSVHNTGCLALARLNAEGMVAGCEGDVPAMLSMMVARALLGVSGFQANPARINTETGELLFAHCTIPLNMVTRYELDTHFESGIGVGIRGYMPEGDVTIFKMAGGLNRYFIEEGRLIRNQSEQNLCRTQQVIQLDDKSKASYFLTNPIGNHHIILPGHCKQLLEMLLSSML